MTRFIREERRRGPRPPQVSVVVPTYNEAVNVAAFHTRVVDALAGEQFELVFVDDGSRDETVELISALAGEDPRVRLVQLSRNFGKEAALTAGLDESRGDAVIMIDADLQDPPELIPEMLRVWRDGAGVVCAVRRARHGESWLKVVTAQWFYSTFRRLTNLGDGTPNAADFRLLDRRAVDALREMREQNRYVRGLAAWVGFSQVNIEYDRDPRHAGTSKFPARKLLRLATDAILAFSNVPLRLISGLGALAVGAVMVWALATAVGSAAGIDHIEFRPTQAALLGLAAMQLLALGIVGEYVGRVHDESRRRPLYVVQRRVGGRRTVAGEPASDWLPDELLEERRAPAGRA